MIYRSFFLGNGKYQFVLVAGMRGSVSRIWKPEKFIQPDAIKMVTAEE